MARRFRPALQTTIAPTTDTYFRALSKATGTPVGKLIDDMAEEHLRRREQDPTPNLSHTA